MAMDGLDEGYNMAEVSKKYRIPRSSLRDYYESKTKGRKMEPKTILTKEEKDKLVEYIKLMVHWRHPITSMQIKNKIAEITQQREIFFKKGIIGKSWLRLFRYRYPQFSPKGARGT